MISYLLIIINENLPSRRLIENQKLFSKLLEKASNQNVLIRKAIGLNAPGMANRFALEGAEVLLGADLSMEYEILNYPATGIL